MKCPGYLSEYSSTWKSDPHKANTPFRSADELWSSLGYARSNNCNLLANVGPRPDGSFPEEAVSLLREVGRRIESEGLPREDAAEEPQKAEEE